jgi:TetR/AcrR family transcriptional regulator, cholesterol catabolism regulator
LFPEFLLFIFAAEKNLIMEDIITKVTQLYMKYGIRSVTMDDVARELGISKKTLYLHFKDKDELVKKVVGVHMTSLQSEFENSHKSSNNAIENLLYMSRVLTQMLKQANPSVTYDLQKYYPEIWKNTVMSRHEHIFNQIKANMIQGIKEDLYRTDLDVDIIAHLYLFRVEMSQLFEVMEEKKFSFENVFKAIFIYHIRGIANKKGIEFLEKKLKIDELQ